MGVFFVIPLYLQLVLGLDALETGIKMLPVSIAMFLASADRAPGCRPASPSARSSAPGCGSTVVAAVVLLATIQPDLADAGFAVVDGRCSASAWG